MGARAVLPGIIGAAGFSPDDELESESAHLRAVPFRSVRSDHG